MLPRFLALLLLLIAAHFPSFAVEASEPPPRWLLAGLLMIETSSFYKDSGTIEYVNRKDGKRGELGPFQMMKKTFEEVAPGEDFTRLRIDPMFAESKAKAYLTYLYDGPAQQDWETVAGMWNFGPSGFHRNPVQAQAYARKVRLAGQKAK